MIKSIKRLVKGSLLEKPARFVLNKIVRPVLIFVRNIQFYFRNIHLSNERKIIYALIPPPSLNNIGDHAQVVAIQKWLGKYFNEYEVLEVDKNQSTNFIMALQILINQDDLIILHSGGNLNDRSLWSEGARRELVKSFPDNKIVSLPQTVYFSDTPRGRGELKTSRNIYDKHPDLTITARDPKSLEIIKENFDVKTGAYPDFALMLDSEVYVSKHERKGVLLLLRNDPESNIGELEREKITRFVDDLGKESNFYDTTLEKPIKREQREAILSDTLNHIAQHEVVITDRFHGMIFAVITETPCIAIDTVDHKISSSYEWFKDTQSVQHLKELDKIPEFLNELTDPKIRNNPQIKDWEDLYFENLAHLIKEEVKNAGSTG